MKAVTYITENTIMKFLYNPKKTFLEGFVKEWLRFDSGTYQDYGKYVRFLKVAIRDNVSELYILKSPDMVYTYVMKHHESSEFWFGFYKNYNLVVHLLMLAYGFRWVWGAIRVLKGNPDALTDEESQRLYKASRINAEKDEAYWNGYWDGFIG